LDQGEECQGFLECRPPARRFDRQKIYSARGGNARYRPDVCSLGGRLLRTTPLG
jgi:hypothetical protein